MRRILMALRRLYGVPCWGIEPSFFPALMIEFGRPHLWIHGPYKTESRSRSIRERAAKRNVSVRGDWSLWIYCCNWTVFDGSRLVGDSTTKKRIERAVRYLGGQKLVNAQLVVRGMRTLFEFDLGGRLETRPWDRSSEQWLLYEPNGNVLTVRADKRYSYGSGNQQPDRKKWLAIDA